MKEAKFKNDILLVPTEILCRTCIHCCIKDLLITNAHTSSCKTMLTWWLLTHVQKLTVSSERYPNFDYLEVMEHVEYWTAARSTETKHHSTSEMQLLIFARLNHPWLLTFILTTIYSITYPVTAIIYHSVNHWSPQLLKHCSYQRAKQPTILRRYLVAANCNRHSIIISINDPNHQQYFAINWLSP